jgi:hypothetical protein
MKEYGDRHEVPQMADASRETFNVKKHPSSSAMLVSFPLISDVCLMRPALLHDENKGCLPKQRSYKNSSAMHTSYPLPA